MRFLHELRKHLDKMHVIEKISCMNLNLTRLTAQPYFIMKGVMDKEQEQTLKDLILQSAKLEWGNEVSVFFDEEKVTVTDNAHGRREEIFREIGPESKGSHA